MGDDQASKEGEMENEFYKSNNGRKKEQKQKSKKAAEKIQPPF